MTPQPWYDFGGGFMLPSIRASDLTWNPASSLSYGGDMQEYDRPRASISLGGNYGHLNQPDFGTSSNYMLSGYDPYSNVNPFAGDTFDLTTKTGDKVGSTVTFKREGDYWVPQVTSRRDWEWDSNGSPGRALIVPAMALGGWALSPYISQAGTALEGLLGAGGGGIGAADAMMMEGAAGAGGASAAEMAALGAEAVGSGGVPTGMGAGGAAGASGIPGLSNLSPSTLLRAGGLLGGLLGGGAAGGSGGGGSDPYNVAPVATPPLYGGADPGASRSFQTFGNTDTERYMTQSYLPSLFGGQSNPAAIPQVPSPQQSMPQVPSQGVAMRPDNGMARSPFAGLLGPKFGSWMPPVRRSPLLG